MTFIDDQSEYRVKFYPNTYNKDWCFVRKKEQLEEGSDESPPVYQDEGSDDDVWYQGEADC